MSAAESELESFRQRWREDISKRTEATSSSTVDSRQAAQSAQSSQSRRTPWPNTSQSTSTTFHSTPIDIHDDFEPRTYHDLEDRDDHLTLAAAEERHKTVVKEPKTALEHYEKAVEKESAGRMGDSVSLYRKAFKLDSQVHEQYKQKHFPPRPRSKLTNTTDSALQPTLAGPSDAVPACAVPASDAKAANITELLEEFSHLSILPAEPEMSLSPPSPCPIASLPEEILILVLRYVAVQDVGSFARLSLACKRFAYLTATEDRIWKIVALGNEFGFAAMLYRYVVDLRGRPLQDVDPDLPRLRQPVLDMTPTAYPTYRSQFRMRPRLRFNGCYISTVNYTRPGLSHQSQYTWNSPVLIVTYYRYLRFFRDGTVISLLTTAEPSDVVHYLKKENLDIQHSNSLPTSVMKDALRGRWRLTGPASAGEDDVLDGEDTVKGPGEYAKEPPDDWTLLAEQEAEGHVNIETEGVSAKYMWKMQLAIGSAGRKDGTRNNKLSWKGFWSYNRLTDDWAEFGLKNDRAFYFSRVKSYGMGR